MNNETSKQLIPIIISVAFCAVVGSGIALLSAKNSSPAPQNQPAKTTQNQISNAENSSAEEVDPQTKKDFETIFAEAKKMKQEKSILWREHSTLELKIRLFENGHEELSEKLEFMDVEAGMGISPAKFYVLSNVVCTDSGFVTTHTSSPTTVLMTPLSPSSGICKEI